MLLMRADKGFIKEEQLKQMNENKVPFVVIETDNVLEVDMKKQLSEKHYTFLEDCMLIGDKDKCESRQCMFRSIKRSIKFEKQNSNDVGVFTQNEKSTNFMRKTR